MIQYIIYNLIMISSQNENAITLKYCVGMGNSYSSWPRTNHNKFALTPPGIEFSMIAPSNFVENKLRWTPQPTPWTGSTFQWATCQEQNIFNG